MCVCVCVCVCVYVCVSCNRTKLVLSSASEQIILNMFETFIQVIVCSWGSENI